MERIADLTMLLLTHLLIATTTIIQASSNNLRYVERQERQQTQTSAFSSISQRIVGGDRVVGGDYPWFAYSDAGCGASLISPKHILTAAHCADAFIVESSVRVGAVCNGHHNNCGENFETFKIAKRHLHPDYTLMTSSHDIAVMTLDGLSKISPVPLDLHNLSSTYTKETKLWVTGFGRVDPDIIDLPFRLRHAEVSVVPQKECVATYTLSSLNAHIGSDMICAADTGKDACQGDSGGPLYDKINNVLAGLVSWGFGCANPDYPGVYSRISDQASWIKDTVCNDFGVEEQAPDFCLDNEELNLTPPAAPLCAGNQTSVAIDLTTDKYAEETEWTIMDMSTGDILYFGTNFEKNTPYASELCLDQEGCYKFVITDSYGDGISYPGKFQLMEDGKIRLSDYGLTYEASKFLGSGCQLTPSPTTTPTMMMTSHIPCNTDETTVLFELSTDLYPKEMSWEIIDLYNGDVIDHMNLEIPLQQHTWTLCLPQSHNEACHELSVYDSNGDGFLDTGGFSITVDDKLLMDYYDKTEPWGMKTATIGCTAPFSCTDDDISFHFELMTGSNVSKRNWDIIDMETGKIIKVGRELEDHQQYNWAFCLPQSCYDFTIHYLSEYDTSSIISSLLTVDDAEFFSRSGNDADNKSFFRDNRGSVTASIGCNNPLTCNPGETLVSLQPKEILTGASISWELMNRKTGVIVGDGRGFRGEDGRHISKICVLPSCYHLTTYSLDYLPADFIVSVDGNQIIQESRNRGIVSDIWKFCTPGGNMQNATQNEPTSDDMINNTTASDDTLQDDPYITEEPDNEETNTAISMGSTLSNILLLMWLSLFLL